jgi:hypothetical protein
LEKEIQDRRNGEGSMQARTHAFWKKIWALKVPNATKISFGEPATIFFLPRKILKREEWLRRIYVFSVVKSKKQFSIVCGHAHQLRMCGEAALRFFQKCGSAGCDFIGLLEELMEKTTEENVNLFAEIAREIWKRRNTVLHGGVLLTQRDCSKLGNGIVKAIWRANSEELSKDDEPEVNIGVDAKFVINGKLPLMDFIKLTGTLPFRWTKNAWVLE